MKKKFYLSSYAHCSGLTVMFMLFFFASWVTQAQTAPATPTDFVASASSSSYEITLTWTDNADDETEYMIVRDDPYECCKYYTLPANTTSFVDTDVDANIQYWYALTAYNEFGHSDPVDAGATIVREAPPKPTQVIAAPGPHTAIEVVFPDQSNLETYYEIQHSNNPDIFYGSGTVTSTGSDTVRFTFNTEPSNSSMYHIHYHPGTTVYVRVRGVRNDGGNLIYGPFSDIVTTMARPYPAAPSSLMITSQDGKVKLSWNDNADYEAAYFIWRIKDNFTAIEEFVVGANVTSFVDPTAALFTTYTYRIQALNSYEITYPREHWFFTEGRYVEITGMATDAGIAPTNVTAIGTSPLHIMVTFTDNISNEDGYDVHFSNADSTYTEIWTVDGKVGIGETIETEASYDFGPGTTVYVRVRSFNYDAATDTFIYGPFSERVSCVIPSRFPDVPENLEAAAEGNAIRLTWTDPSGDDDPYNEAAFEIMRANDGGSNYNTLFTLPANTSTFLDTTVVPGVTYTYRLSAVNAYGHSYESAFVSFQAPHATLVAPVATLATFVTSTSFTANWNAVEGATHYKLYVYVTRDSSLVSGYNGKHVVGTSFTVTGLSSSRRYLYRVTAVNDFMESDKSNIITVAPVKDLTLRSVCSADPSSFRRWRIVNNNPFPINVNWEVLASGATGTTSALPGESYFVTPTATGNYTAQINYTTIRWIDDKLIERSSTKSSIKTQCSDSTSMMGMDLAIVDSGEDVLVVNAYPNVVRDELTIVLESAMDGVAEVSLLNLQGQEKETHRVLLNKSFSMDVASYPAGLYLLRASYGKINKSIRVVKE